MKKEWQKVELNLDEWIEFVAMDPIPGGQNLGRAEFDLCPVYRRGKMIEFYIYPRQQRVDKYYHYKGALDSIDWTISSSDGLDEPNIWRFGWCKEHKNLTMSMYVPTGSRYLFFDYHGLTFHRKKFGGIDKSLGSAMIHSKEQVSCFGQKFMTGG